MGTFESLYKALKDNMMSHFLLSPLPQHLFSHAEAQTASHWCVSVFDTHTHTHSGADESHKYARQEILPEPSARL